MKQTILNSWQENRTLSMINQTQIMKQEIKLSVMQKLQNLIFLITAMLTF